MFVLLLVVSSDALVLSELLRLGWSKAILSWLAKFINLFLFVLLSSAVLGEMCEYMHRKLARMYWYFLLPVMLVLASWQAWEQSHGLILGWSNSIISWLYIPIFLLLLFHGSLRMLIETCEYVARKLGRMSRTLVWMYLKLVCMYRDFFTPDDWDVDPLVEHYVRQQAACLEFASPRLRAEKSIVMLAVSQEGRTLRHADSKLKDDVDVVRRAINQDATAIEYASAQLRDNYEILLLAGSRVPSFAAKFASKRLKCETDLFQILGLKDTPSSLDDKRKERAVMSVKYAFAPASRTYSSDIFLSSRQSPIMRQFHIYNPNLVSKGFCGSQFLLRHLITSNWWPCTGDPTTCWKTAQEDDGKPRDESCWRYSFWWHLQQALDTHGFVIQVVEADGLGYGQILEQEMAQRLGIKIFSIMETQGRSAASQVKELGNKVKAWYRSGCKNKDIWTVG